MDLTRKYGGDKSWITIDCGDGDKFKVLVDPRKYTFDEQIEIMAQLEATQGPVLTDGAGQVVLDPATGLPRRQMTAAALKLMIGWSSGYILDFDGLEIEGQPVTGVDGFEKLKRFPEVVGLVFNGVMENIGPKKPNATPLNSGSTVADQEELVLHGRAVS